MRVRHKSGVVGFSNQSTLPAQRRFVCGSTSGSASVLSTNLESTFLYPSTHPPPRRWTPEPPEGVTELEGRRVHDFTWKAHRDRPTITGVVGPGSFLHCLHISPLFHQTPSLVSVLDNVRTGGQRGQDTDTNRRLQRLPKPCLHPLPFLRDERR